MLRVSKTNIWPSAANIKRLVSIETAVKFAALKMRGLISATGMTMAAIAPTRPISRRLKILVQPLSAVAAALTA